MAEYTKDIPFSEVNEQITGAMIPPRTFYFLTMLFLSLVIGWGILAWVFQSKAGMNVTGLNHPVGWGVYITNFVFWVGIAHSGTLISAILYLVRSKWRDAVSRSTEAMTVFAVLVAGLFPLIHLGRLWVFYYILPYPNQRDLFPNFMSPLVLDVMAVFTYLNVSIIFFYFGLIPDAAAVRDYFRKKCGSRYWKTQFFGALALGWSGTLRQWRHYNRSYLYFAMLATPLVISVHSIVSWDFAVSLLPGWHSTIFPPYFVAGAIHSGLAMALTLLIPMRKLLGLEELITHKHLHAIARLMVLTTLIIAYAYIIEPFIEDYSGSIFHHQFSQWRMTGSMAWMYYLILVLNVLVPMSFLFERVRRKIFWLFVASLLVNLGMWLERYMIVVGSTAHDYMPHNWGRYLPTWVELSISVGAAALFIFLFLGFAKYLPVISIADFKDYLIREKIPEPRRHHQTVRTPAFIPGERQRMFLFTSPAGLINAVDILCGKGFRRFEVFSPVKLPELEQMLNMDKSLVWLWTAAGGVAGFGCGYALTVGTAGIYDLIVGGKHPDSLFAYLLVMFELTVLFASFANLFASLVYTGLYKRKIHPHYDTRFSSGRFGLLLSYSKSEEQYILATCQSFKAEADDAEE